MKMKLRNKKTGEIWNIGKILTNDYPSYDTLESIIEDFEYCKEPIIKDFKFYDDYEDMIKYPTSYVLKINFDKREVETNCGDFYYDYTISFDNFIKVADYIKEKEGKQ